MDAVERRDVGNRRILAQLLVVSRLIAAPEQRKSILANGLANSAGIDQTDEPIPSGKNPLQMCLRSGL